MRPPFRGSQSLFADHTRRLQSENDRLSTAFGGQEVGSGRAVPSTKLTPPSACPTCPLPLSSCTARQSGVRIRRDGRISQRTPGTVHYRGHLESAFRFGAHIAGTTHGQRARAFASSNKRQGARTWVFAGFSVFTVECVVRDQAGGQSSASAACAQRWFSA